MSSRAKVALVTSAGTGIGKHVTIALLREGYSVVLAGRRDPLEATVRETKEFGSQTFMLIFVMLLLILVAAWAQAPALV